MIRSRYRSKNRTRQQPTTKAANTKNRSTGIRKQESRNSRNNDTRKTAKTDQNNNGNDENFRPYPKVNNSDVPSKSVSRPYREKAVKRSDTYSANSRTRDNGTSPSKDGTRGRTKGSRSASVPRRRPPAAAPTRRSWSSDVRIKSGNAFSWKQSNKLKYQENSDMQSNDANVSSRRSRTSEFKYPLAKASSREPSIERNNGRSFRHSK